MTRIQIQLICFIIIIIATCGKAALSCDDNEFEVECPREDCPRENCPNNEYSDQGPCTVPNPCMPACKCIFNYRRAANGTCIPTTECPPLDCSATPHQHYDPCPSYCPSESCSSATPDGKCNFVGVGPVVQCSPACRCDLPKYWRKDGACVRFENCHT